MRGRRLSSPIHSVGFRIQLGRIRFVHLMREDNQTEDMSAHTDLRSESAFRAVAFRANALVIQRVEVGFDIVPEGFREGWAPGVDGHAQHDFSARRHDVAF